MVYERLEPFGEDRADWRTAVLCSAFANTWKGKGDKPVTPDEIMKAFFNYDRRWLEEIKIINQDSTGMAKLLSISAQKGLITSYQGAAPAIKRIGKKGKPTPSKQKLWRILNGESG